MTNVTVTVDEETLKRARIRALEQGTSVNKVLGDFLAVYAGSDRTSSAVARALDIAKRSAAGSGTGGRRWTREELHDR